MAFSQDSSAILHGGNAGLQAYTNELGPIGIREMLAVYGGNRRELAHDLAGFKGTKESSQMRSIGKWLNYDLGKPGEQRNALKNKATQGQFRALMARKQPPANATIHISGPTKYSQDERDRDFTINSSDYPIDTGAMLAAIAQGDAAGAYEALLASYAPEMEIGAGASVTISFF